MRAVFVNVFWFLDLIYLAIASLVCQFLALPEIVSLLISLPFFIIVPSRLGCFIRSFSKSNSFSGLSDPILVSVVDWCMGVFLLFSTALLLHGLSLFNAYLFTALTLFILVLAKFHSRKKGNRQLHKILKAIESNFYDYRVMLLALLVGLVPIFLVYPHWPFPLKVASDAFTTNMLTLQITEENLIDMFSSGIHQPVMAILLSVPCLLFNVFPINFYWGLPLLVFPIFSLIVYVFSYKISNSMLLSIFASIIAVCAFGDGTAVHLYLVHHRDIVQLLFPVATLLVTTRVSGPNQTNSVRGAGFFQTVAFSLLTFSVIELSLVPSADRLPSIFLGLIYIVFLFVFFSDIFKQTLRRVMKYLSLTILVFATFCFYSFFYSVRPDFLSWSFISTVIGLVSAFLLIIYILFPRIKLLYTCDRYFLVVSLCTLLFHQQLGIFMTLILLTSTMLYHFAQNHRLSLNLVWFFITTLLVLIIIEKSGLLSFFSFAPSDVSVQYLSTFNSRYRLLEEVFTTTVLILFMSGAFFSLVYRRVKEISILFVGCSFLTYYFMPISNSYRAIIFLVPIVAYFAANTFQIWNKLFPKKTLQLKLTLFYSKLATIKLSKSHILFLILLLGFLPVLLQPYTNFIAYSDQKSNPLYTFDHYDYDVARWVHDNTAEDVLIISDPFSARLISRLSNRRLIVTQRFIYDEQGHNRVIGKDPMIVNKTKAFLSTVNVTLALNNLMELRETYLLSKQFNEQLGSVVSIDTIPIIIILNGRTSEWINSDKISDVFFPQDFEFLPSYSKFFKSDYFDLLYENDGQIFVFELRNGVLT